ncbi:MAG: hypothetical protein ACJ75J_04310 [Cytophagaceae bacterium]
MQLSSNILIILMLLLGRNVFGQNKNPFLSLQYDSVLIYDFDWRGKQEYFSIVDASDHLAPTVRKSAGLDRKQYAKLNKLLGEKSSFGQSTAACFEPHLGVVYYKAGKPLAYMTICMACNRLEASIRIPAQEQGVQIAEGLTYYTKVGMGKSLRKYLYHLMASNDFRYGDQKSTLFD